jgi:excisionase family DNA binding protein
MNAPVELLSTGEAARILGTTSRHVAHLADHGERPYTLAGTHRRIGRADVERLASLRAPAGGGPMTLDQRQSLWLGHLTAAQVVQDPERVRSDARQWAERHIAGALPGSRGCASGYAHRPGSGRRARHARGHVTQGYLTDVISKGKDLIVIVDDEPLPASKCE